MTEQPEPSKEQSNNPPAPAGKPEDSALAALTPDVRVFFQDSYRKISQVLDIIEDAEETLDFLELQSESTENLFFSARAKIVPLSEYLYLISLQCRKLIKSNVGYFYAKEWCAEDDELFELAFRKLQRCWTTYNRILRRYNESTWDQGPLPSRILQGLEDPRDAFIEALGKYRLQLQVALSHI